MWTDNLFSVKATRDLLFYVIERKKLIISIYS